VLAESRSDLYQIIKPDVSFAAFNAANVGRMETAMGRQFFLRPSLGVAQCPDGFSGIAPVDFAGR
jgi:hypothetical protein